MITAQQLRQKFLSFFEKKRHKIIPSASLIPQDDPTVLFTTAGMHPLVPYLLGEKHPSGQRLTNVQKCIRTGDIDEVGDACHLTFFEMLGNWSLGDYFKRQAIEWSFEFLTGELKIPLNKLAVSVFEGLPKSVFKTKLKIGKVKILESETWKGQKIPADWKSFEIWKSLGVSEQRIAFLGMEDNWWGPAGQTGPCGPDTEMFYWTGKNPAPKKFNPKDERWVEIWNDVFMEYKKKRKAKSEKRKAEEYEFVPLKQKNVDTGMGLERTLAVLNGKASVFETELFEPIIRVVLSLRGATERSDEAIPPRVANHEIAAPRPAASARNDNNIKAIRIIADHLKAATFILAEGIEPSNVERGYVLRRLIRRAIRYGKLLGIEEALTADIAAAVIDIYQNTYPELKNNQQFIFNELKKEEARFRKTLAQGLKEFEKIITKIPSPFLRGRVREGESILNSKAAFDLYQTYGFPLEMTQELAHERGLKVDQKGFQEELKKHQELSRTAASGKFKSGLADDSQKTVKYHTATHLLHAALRQVLGKSVQQKGSNITSERLRFDFSYDQKLTGEQLSRVEKIVNQIIKKNLPVERQTLSYKQAIKSGALAFFRDKYPEKVTVYSIGDFSREVCAGPHAKRTGGLGHFKIIKQESAGAGLRRIKAILE